MSPKPWRTAGAPIPGMHSVRCEEEAILKEGVALRLVALAQRHIVHAKRVPFIVRAPAQLVLPGLSHQRGGVVLGPVEELHDEQLALVAVEQHGQAASDASVPQRRCHAQLDADLGEDGLHFLTARQRRLPQRAVIDTAWLMAG